MHTSFLSANVLLILVTDPLGNIPLFIAALKRVPPERRRFVILRECMIAYVILLLFMLFGKTVLEIMQLSDASLTVAGGVILFLIALRMIFPSEGASLVSGETDNEPFVVPIAIPLIAGPSALATVMLMATREPGRLPEWGAAITLCMLVTFIVFLCSARLQKILGDQTLAAVEKLMGLILTAISIQMLMSGIASFIHDLPV